MISKKNAHIQTALALIGVGLIVTGAICMTQTSPDHSRSKCGIPQPENGLIMDIGIVMVLCQIIYNGLRGYLTEENERASLIQPSVNSATLFLTSSIVNNSTEVSGANNTALNHNI